MLPVSALSSYVHCPRQFFVHYVLKEVLPPKDVIVLGLIKHKVYELLSDAEEKLVLSVTSNTDVPALFRAHFVRLLQDSVRKYRFALKQVNVPLVDAFRRCLPAVEFEAQDRAISVSLLAERGLFGSDLWGELSPKMRSEYVVKSDSLRLSGRVDRLACFHDSVMPVELKSGRPPSDGVWDAHRIQAAAYCMLLSERFNADVPKAVVHYLEANVKRDVVMNPFLRDWVLEIRDKCFQTIDSNIPPEGCGREGCAYCNRKL